MQKEVVVGIVYLLSNIFSFLFFILSIINFFIIIKIQIFNDTYIIKAFKIAAKDEGFKAVRFTQRVFYELQARTEKQKRKYDLMKYLFLKSFAYIFLAMFMINPYQFLILGFISLLLFAFTPNAFLKYVNKIIKD